MSERTARITRSTKETVVRAEMSVDGTGGAKVNSGFPFLDHCLETLALHAAFDLEVSVESDRPDLHHVSEDIGWTLGTLLRKCCLSTDAESKSLAGIQRFGWAVIPFDAILMLCSVDLVGRPGYYLEPSDGLCRHDIEEFFTGFSMGSGATLHLQVLQKGNFHHEIECAFKAVGKALRQAVVEDHVLRDVSAKGTVKYEWQ